METRNYKVGDHVFKVELDSPWNFMEYTETVAERIRAAAAGEILNIKPTRAGDKLQARTFVKNKHELPASMNGHTLDFSQYEPFYTREEASLFSLRVCSSEPSWIEEEKASGKIKLILKVDKDLPCYYIYDRGGETIYELDADRGKIAGILRVSKDYKYGEYYPKQNFYGYSALPHICTSLMMMYTYNSSRLSTLLIHSSVIKYNGKAMMFLGTSGTGKSTHSRLWLDNIEGAELINDDNPVIRLIKDSAGEDKLFVYGSPWSGKTPCYRNVKEEAGGIVRLDQAPVNEIQKLKGLQAYAGIVASCSIVRWDRGIMDNITRTASQIAMSVPCYDLKCLPDAEAALLCRSSLIFY